MGILGARLSGAIHFFRRRRLVVVAMRVGGGAIMPRMGFGPCGGNASLLKEMMHPMRRGTDDKKEKYAGNDQAGVV